RRSRARSRLRLRRRRLLPDVFRLLGGHPSRRDQTARRRQVTPPLTNAKGGRRTARLPDGFRSIVFDCDSTLVSVEGIDELAGAHKEAVQALTDAAMEGSVPLDEVYGRRLEIIRPTRARVDEL